MDHETPKHEKIRFRRREINDLCAFPSYVDPGTPQPRFARRAGKAIFRLFAGFVLLLALAVLAVYAIGLSGVGSERLRTEAEKALERVAGMDMDVAMGAARLTLDGASFLALEVSDVSLKRSKDGADIVDASLVRFGIHFLPLLSGDVRLSSATLSDAHVMVAALPAGKRDWTLALRNEQGLIDPERVSDALFAAVHGGLGLVRSGSIRDVSLENLDIVFPPDSLLKTVRIVDASLAEAGAGNLSFEADANIDGRLLTISASAARDEASDRISALSVSISGAAPGRDEALAKAGYKIGVIDLKITGVEANGATPSKLNALLSVKDTTLDLGRRGIVAGDVDFGGTLVHGANKLQVDYLRASVGRSLLDFYGSIGPRPPSGEPGDEPAYRFDLISAKSILSPEESPEPAMNAYIRLAGVYLADQKKLLADNLLLKGGPGEALGTVAVQFSPGQQPGISAAFSLHDMQVSQAKQLWPWFSAQPARLWVLRNVFGGKVADATVQLQVPPGRLGNGVPLNGSESFGTFAVEGARFDTAGLLPPVRDAIGVVKFGGADVDISLSSGTVFLPSGQTVAVSDGTLQILKANVPPVIGALDIDVKGDASAVIELASYDPINAMRFLPVTAIDFSGKVSGNVKADIPLQKGIDRKLLSWRVEMGYEGLAIAKPFDGQMVTDATGTIVVQPDRAVIATKAKLNGIPAEISMVQPLSEAGPERQRTVTLILDDKQRNTLLPGLSDLLDGTIKVTLEAAGVGKQRVSADLTQARLDIPWVGWSKGPGIAGKVDFVMETVNGATTLSDFSLTGKTFALNGTVSLSGGALASANFKNAKLNRDDDVAVSVKRSGKGYAVTVNGNSLDARSIVKLFLSDKNDAEAKKYDPGSVTVKGNVGSLTGFHEERLSNVSLDYSGSGGRVDALTVSATTKAGRSVELRNGSEGGGRTMRMTSSDAGAILRFLDIYENMEGGTIDLSLKGGADGPMTGQVDARDFWAVNEPRLSSLVSTTPPGGDRSLNEAVKRDIDTSRVKFERGFTQIEKGAGYLNLSQGVLRGPLIGMTFQGGFYDKRGNMDMTGTFMPAYGLNRIFGEIPLIGMILGNGRDRGLIGVTFKLEGKADSPTLTINPLSVIAPGIFRSIFEFQ